MNSYQFVVALVELCLLSSLCKERINRCKFRMKNIRNTIRQSVCLWDWPSPFANLEEWWSWTVASVR
jgi:hypothetical protein